VTMAMKKLLVTPAANIRVRPPRSAFRWLSSSGSTNAPTGSAVNVAMPIEEISMSSTRHSRPWPPSWTISATNSPRTISGATDNGRKSLTPGMTSTLRGWLSSVGCGDSTANRAALSSIRNAPTITTSATPTPAFAQARQNRL